jgi:hypothetical protein
MVTGTARMPRHTLRCLHLAAAPGEHVDRRLIATTLRWADEAAAHGDYREALHWLDTVAVTGGELPDTYADKHAAWQVAVQTSRSIRALRHARPSGTT